jgi:hypothetical protein
MVVNPDGVAIRLDVDIPANVPISVPFEGVATVIESGSRAAEVAEVIAAV